MGEHVEDQPHPARQEVGDDVDPDVVTLAHVLAEAEEDDRDRQEGGDLARPDRGIVEEIAQDDVEGDDDHHRHQRRDAGTGEPKGRRCSGPFQHGPQGGEHGHGPVSPYCLPGLYPPIIFLATS